MTAHYILFWMRIKMYPEIMIKLSYKNYLVCTAELLLEFTWGTNWGKICIRAARRVSHKSKTQDEIFHGSRDAMTFSGLFINLTFFFSHSAFHSIWAKQCKSSPDFTNIGLWFGRGIIFLKQVIKTSPK